MNRTTRNLHATLAIVVTATFSAYVHAKPVDCAKPAIGTGEVQACRAAAQGVSELRQYIQRTQGIHILYMRDFADAVPAS
jgi:hypothetical protein